MGPAPWRLRLQSNPAGTKVLVFETPLNRATWDPHGVRGFYVGPALSHYRCYDVYIPATKRVRTSDTLSWHPADVVMPGSSQTELLTAAVEGLHQAVTLIRQSPTHLATARQALQSLDAPALDTLRERHNIFTASEGATPRGPLDWQGDAHLPLIVPSPIFPPGLDVSRPSDSTPRPSRHHLSSPTIRGCALPPPTFPLSSSMIQLTRVRLRG
jgi:hypothetical protein